MPADAKPPAVRMARAVIDAALKENRPWEQLCYWIIVASVVAGILVLLIGAWVGSIATMFATSTMGVFIWPALRASIEYRKENMAMRLMELPLSRAATADQAADAISVVFTEQFSKGKNRVEIPETKTNS